MRIVIFGIGKFYNSRREELAKLCEDDEVIAFFDNKIQKEQKIDGVPVMNPKQIKLVKFDCIVIMSIYIQEIYNQLCMLEVAAEKIYTWKHFRADKTGGKIEKYPAMLSCSGKKLLIVANPIGYDGGSMTAIYAAMAMRSWHYCVWIITAFVKKELKEYLLSEGINIAICDDIPYFGQHTKRWINSFSVIMVNVFPNVHCVYELGKIKPVVWWLHESDVYGKIYQKTFESFPWYRETLEIDTVNVVAVSDKAKENFQRYYPSIDVRIMPYGLPDEILNIDYGHEKMIFAIIGNVCYLKGQDIFIDAALRAISEERTKAEFWIIGSILGDYAKELLQRVDNIDCIKVKGEVNRAEMKKLLSEMDVVVSASREDSLPIVITEGLMNSKACIISDAIGTTKYIQHMKNGIIFKSQDVEDLAKKMRWCLNNRSRLNKIGNMARNTYEEVFSMAAFADRLEEEVSYAEAKWDV